MTTERLGPGTYRVFGHEPSQLASAMAELMAEIDGPDGEFAVDAAQVQRLVHQDPNTAADGVGITDTAIGGIASPFSYTIGPDGGVIRGVRRGALVRILRFARQWDSRAYAHRQTP